VVPEKIRSKKNTVTIMNQYLLELSTRRMIGGYYYYLTMNGLRNGHCRADNQFSINQVRKMKIKVKI